MNLSTLDWIIVVASAMFFIVAAQRCRQYVKSTSDFLAANRLAGRYLLAMAQGQVILAAVGIVAEWQIMYRAGFASGWWRQLEGPLIIFMALIGWCIYRFRETRALTLAQFLEMRYSRRFRIYAASVCWISGILNYGIFPAIAADFFMNYCGLAQTYPLFGFDLPTRASLVIFLVGLALYFTFSGGQLTVLITDFLQSVFCNVVLIVILIVLLVKFPLGKVFEGLMIAEPGKSLVNPFDAHEVKGFTPAYFLIGIFALFFNQFAWQGKQGYNSSAKSPHEAKMAGVLAIFRSWAFTWGIALCPLVAYAIMHHPDYADMAAAVTAKLNLIENEQVRDQMITPLTMTQYMPLGLMGAFVAVMLAAFVSTNNTYMHSWGSIVVQDIILPVRKRPVSNKTHLLLLRGGTIFVGVYAICWSIFVPQFMDIWMFFALTGAIWLGGAGVVVIGGLYTRWGTTAGAYAALTGGSVLAVTGCTLHYFKVPWMVDESTYPMAKYLTGQWTYFWAIMTGITLYVSISLLGKRRRYNLEKMLHRGKYAIRSDRVVAEDGTLVDNPAAKWNWKLALGITSEFTRGDKVIYGISIGKTLILFIAFITMTAVAMFFGLSDRQWSTYHRIMLTFWISTSFLIAIWLAVGGYRDAVALFRDLKKAKRDYSDDGTVRDHDYQEPVKKADNNTEQKE